MRTLLLAGLVGCWSGAAKPVEEPAPAPTSSYGGATYGILGSTALTQGGAFASLTGTGDLSSGFDDDADIYGGLIGAEAGRDGGLGSPGTSGGGGIGGTIGTGRYGSIGHGSGTGSGYGVGGGRGPRTSKPPSTSIGQPTTSDVSLDKAIIRRYIKRNIQKLTYCYEKELLVTAKLTGTVTAKFTIGVDGLVVSSTASGLTANVDGCVANVIRAIEFPKPKGGGVVNVSYPFTFKPEA